ncbi:MAG: permease-like cell division protein FtsX [Oscillospiraceae bacterium]|nr:permease-like cell division protein FtsX [Oscillospiraceae bacterium]
MISKTGYLIREGFRGIFTHKFMSFATVAVIVACLIIIGSLGVVSVNISSLIHNLEQENEVVAFVEENLSDEEARGLEASISGIENIASVEYVTKETAMDNFMKDYDSVLMEGIDSSVFRNRYVVHLNDISKMLETRDALAAIPGIAKVNAHIDYANGFITVRNIVTVISLVLVAVLVLVSFFIMSNTIKLATYSRQDEIAIMRMVGATNGFIRLPFVVEGLVLGILGALIAFFAEWGLYELVTGKVMETIAGTFVKVVPFSELALPVLLIFLAIGVVIGGVGGVNAIRNYLKV